MVRVPLPLLLPLLSLIATIHCQANDPEIVTITQVHSHSVFRGTQVILSCSSNKPLNNLYFLRNVSGHVDRVIATGTNEGVGQENFDVTPEREGVYSCVNGNTSSRNTVELVAYPIANLSTPAKYTSHLGTNATINCAFRAGALISRYQVNWYKGLQKLNSNSMKYKVLQNFSLVVTNVTVDDAGRGYYCSVTVNTISTVVHRLGPSVELEVYDQLRMRQGIRDTVQRLGSSDPATFRCTVSGIPQPEIKWIHQGRELAQSRSNNSITRSPSGILVTSELKLGEVIVEDTGAIQCVGYHEVGGRVSVTVSGANLIVLPAYFEPSEAKLEKSWYDSYVIKPQGGLITTYVDSVSVIIATVLLRSSSTNNKIPTEGFTVQLRVRQEGGVQIDATLPSVIPGSFVLVVRYSYNQFTVVEVELLDPSFSNTQYILYTIPKDKLPTFTSFRVTAALRVNGVQGGFSEESHRITLNVAPPTAPPVQECDCPTIDTRAISSETLLIIITFVILFIIIGLVVIIATVACLCFYYHNKNASVVIRQSSLEDRYYDDDIDSKSRSRSVSRSSYGSDGSQFSSRSSSGGEKEEEVDGQSVDSREVHHRCKAETGEFVRELSREDVYYIKEKPKKRAREVTTD